MPRTAIEARNHLVGPCARLVGPDEVSVDVGTLVRRLVLFDCYTLRTIRMREMPALVRAFGEGGLRALLDDGCLRIHCDALTMGSVGSHLPPLTFQFSAVRAHDQDQYVDRCLQEIPRIPGFSSPQITALTQAVMNGLTDGAGGGELATSQLDHDLETHAPVLANGITLAARTILGAQIDASRLRVVVERVDAITVEVQTNLSALVNVDSFTEHVVVERGILAVGGMNVRLELMDRLHAISGCAPGELSVLDGKLRALSAEADPDAHEGRLLRVLALAELPEPDLDRSPAINADRLLEARNLPETQALRTWLRTADQRDDEQIRESFRRVQEALARAVHGRTGKIVRFAVTTGLGFVPGRQSHRKRSRRARRVSDREAC